ncbi:AmmeMemoRadiSam system protein B [bacterium]|jgi:gamma-polyglutamate biosynthesis protein CapA|nr:AmmeMemoRadiSam system protein B [bacterium]MBT4649034.1 AmmeMemoRadiSam system protein B [bacterium]
MFSLKNNKLLIVVLILLVVQAGLVCYFLLLGAQNRESLTSIFRSKIQFENLTLHKSYFASQSFFDEAYENIENLVKKPVDKVYGGIIPHHLMVKENIAAFFEGIEDYDYDTVVLIGPNHFDAGQNDIILSKAKWRTPYGELMPDLVLTDKLIQEGYLVDEAPFYAEHSISGLVSFIKKSLPKANIVPIILKVDTPAEDAFRLAEVLEQSVNQEKTLVLASVDFSHYLTVPVADFHDLKNRSVIESFDFDRVYDLEIDSPASIYAVLKYLELSKKQNAELIFATNSGNLINKTDEPTTSHSIYYFTEGLSTTETLVSSLFFGDLMLDRHVGEVIDSKGIEYIFQGLASEENRFFWGQDILSANLEGTVTNNGDHYLPDIIYDFAWHPDLVKKTQQYNFNHFTLANNHVTDQGQRGIEETRLNLSDLDISFSGCPDGEVGDCSFTIKEVAGKKIGLAAFSMVYHLFDQTQAQEIIANLREETDFMIVNVHWGSEYTHQFSNVQQNVGHGLIDAGADVIIGHHPHVVQGMEVYKNKAIFYSLGNFVFDQYFSLETQEGLAVGISTKFLESDNKEVSFSLFPFRSIENQPVLMNNIEQEIFFSNYLEWSDISENYKTQLKFGSLSL